MFYQWKPYVSVAKRRTKAAKYAKRLSKKGRRLQPVEISGRAIATTFWGKAWCDNLESYSDFENRLPRGRTYVRNGSIIDLQITGGHVIAVVSGSEIYQVEIEIRPLGKSDWARIKKECSRSIFSLMDLLQGRFSQGVMERLTRQYEGLIPTPKEITMRCTCPDWAVVCKHAAAVLYGVGARLDTDPEMLFQLRAVDHLELISHAVDGVNLDAALASSATGSLATEDLGELFGIELDADGASQSTSVLTRRNATDARQRRSETTRSRPVGGRSTKKVKHAKRHRKAAVATVTRSLSKNPAKKKPADKTRKAVVTSTKRPTKDRAKPKRQK